MRFRKRHILSALWILCLASWPAIAGNPQATEWKLKVSVNNAAVRLQPAETSPAIAIVPMGTILNSYEAEGSWFRVVLKPGKEGITIIGYITTSDVEIVEEKTRERIDFWKPEAEEYAGIGLTAKILGGWAYLRGGDVNTGARGLFDQGVERISALGVTIEDRDFKAVDSGYNIGLEVIYGFRPRLGVGLGFNFIHVARDSNLRFRDRDHMQKYLYSVSIVRTYILRLGLDYALPLNRSFALNLSGGPALFFVQYEYDRNFSTLTVEQNFYQKTHANRLGFQGGMEIVLRLDERVGLFLQAMGRYVKISGLEGKEIISETQNDWGLPEVKTEGVLHFVPSTPYPGLSVTPQAPEGGWKAVLDLTGVDLVIGIRVKF